MSYPHDTLSPTLYEPGQNPWEEYYQRQHEEDDRVRQSHTVKYQPRRTKWLRVANVYIRRMFS